MATNETKSIAPLIAQVEGLRGDAHRQRHVELHAALDELAVDLDKPEQAGPKQD